MTEEMQDLCDRYLMCDKLLKECDSTIKTARKNGHCVVERCLMVKFMAFANEMTEIEKQVKKLSVS